ncbi:hypothetical protein [Aliikangiella coralliicola]|uniref:Uncharacterized protein n=1 Tax=Aliikangiella coralliicola TaxID=2592383 RepID=A0A545U8P3_9GAMM|nr:hypothetical protein [Aliikangiella coralliicola]TQV85773.1 hypothetical protein FLL46_17770 [Aliikangiella coralliicola]
MPKSESTLSLKKIIVWLIVLAFIRETIQAGLKVFNDQGEETFFLLRTVELNYYQSGVISLTILLTMAGYYLYKKVSGLPEKEKAD